MPSVLLCSCSGWYILVTMGQKAGNLTLGIGKAGASTVTIIAEDFMHRRANNPLTFSELATILEGAIYKRRAMNKEVSQPQPSASHRQKHCSFMHLL
jgi:6-phosphofructokinase